MPSRLPFLVRRAARIAAVWCAWALPAASAGDTAAATTGGFTVVDDSLLGRTRGELHGGQLTAEGYVPSPDGRESRAHLLYRLPRTIPRGYLEFEVKGLGGLPRDAFNHGGEPALFGMYDGRNLDEPIDYTSHFKNNFYRFVVKQRLAQRQIGVVFVAARPDAPLEANVPAWDSVEARHFTTEQMIDFATPFDPARWYRVRVSWAPDEARVLIDGEEVWSVRPPYPYRPVDQRLWLGSAPGILGVGKYTAQRAGMTFRKVKVVADESPADQAP